MAFVSSPFLFLGKEAVIVFMIVLLRCLTKAQEVQVHLEEEWIMEVEPEALPCPEGSVYLAVEPKEEGNGLCTQSVFATEQNRRREEIAPLPKEEVENVMEWEEEDVATLDFEEDILLEISLMIHLGLNQGSQLSSGLLLLQGLREVHVSFQEYLALDLADEAQIQPDHLSPRTCPQGFETVVEEEAHALIEFSVCPFRQTYPMLLDKHPFLGASNPYSRIPFGDLFVLGPTMVHQMLALCGEMDGRGFQHVLLDQALLSCVPCFPGTVCPTQSLAVSLFLLPQVCPIDTYNNWYGKKNIRSCRACPRLLHAPAVAILQGCHSSPPDDQKNVDNRTFQTAENLQAYTVSIPDTTVASEPLFAEPIGVAQFEALGEAPALKFSDALEEQDHFRTEISQWVAGKMTGILADKNDSVPMAPEIHIIIWAEA